MITEATYRDFGVPPLPQPALLEIIDRLEELQNKVNGVAYTMCDHADRLYGAAPSVGSESGSPGYGSGGTLDLLRDKIDCLADSIAEMSRQAERNCRLT